MPGDIHILVVDDEEDICEILKFNLESEGYIVDAVTSFENAMRKKLEKYQLFLLDVKINGKSGYSLADQIRKVKRLTIPIFFISAQSSENEKLTAFYAGADDYITKPFSVKELIARIKAVLRRFDLNDESADEKDTITVNGIELDIDKKRITVDGIRQNLTPFEFQLLLPLLQNPGRVFGREQLQDKIRHNLNVKSRALDVHILRLRRKLGKYSRFLMARKGHGYCFYAG